MNIFSTLNKIKLLSFLLCLCTLLTVNAQNKPNLSQHDNNAVKLGQNSSGNLSPLEIHKSKKEDLSKRNKFSKHYINADGSYTAVIGAGPVHFEKNGQWTDIDHSIVPSGQGAYSHANTANFFESYFGSTAHKGLMNKAKEGEIKEFLNTRMYWEVNGNKVNIIQSADVPLTVNGENKAYYQNLFGQISAEFTILTGKRKLDYVIPTREALGNIPGNASFLVFEETVELPQNWSYTLEEDGSVSLFDTKNNLIFNYEKPSSNDAEGFPGIENNTRYKVKQQGNLLIIQTKVEAAWLLNENRIFPVKVDPTENYSPENSDWWTGEAYIGAFQGNYHGPFKIGHRRANHTSAYSTYAFLKFNLDGIPANASINSASGYLYQTTIVILSDHNAHWVFKASSYSIPPTETPVQIMESMLGDNLSASIAGTSNHNIWVYNTFNEIGKQYIESSIPTGVVSMGVYPLFSQHNTQDRLAEFKGYNDTNRPYLEITYFDTDVTGAILSAQSAEKCGSGDISISVSVSSNTEGVKWYDVPSGGVPVHDIGVTGSNPWISTLNLTNLQKTTTYYATPYGSGGESDLRVPVRAVIIPELNDFEITATPYPLEYESCLQDYIELKAVNYFTPIFEEDFEDEDNLKFSLHYHSSYPNLISINQEYYSEGSQSILLTSPVDSSTGVGRELWIETNGEIDLTSEENAFLTFDHIAGIEGENLDYATIEYSIDNGGNWQTVPVEFYLGDAFTQYYPAELRFDRHSYPEWFSIFINRDTPNPGSAPGIIWKKEVIDLSSLTGNQIKLRFKMKCNNSVDIYGWLIDNIRIGTTPDPDITWTHSGNLFLDSDLLIPYDDGNKNIDTVYMPSPSLPETYTVTTEFMSCEKSQQENITPFNPSKQFTSNSGFWNISGNWLETGEPTSSDCVRIPAGKSVVVNTENAVAKVIRIDPGGELQINSESVLTIADAIYNLNPTGGFIIEDKGSFVQTEDTPVNNNTGNLQYHRTSSDIIPNQYIYVSSPVESVTLGSISNEENGLYYYYSWVPDFHADYGNWTPHGSSVVMDNGKGYIARVRDNGWPSGGAPYKLKFENGRPNSGDISVEVRSHPSPNGDPLDTKWNLIGNPYPSAVNAFLLDEDPVNTSLNGNYYFWMHLTPASGSNQPPFYPHEYNNSYYSANDYIVKNSQHGSTVPYVDYDDDPDWTLDWAGRTIPSGQSFFVLKDDLPLGLATVTFKNSHRSTGINNGFYRPNELEKARYWVDIINPDNQSGQMLVGYVESGTTGWDRKLDADHMGSETLMLYSVVEERKAIMNFRGYPLDMQDMVDIAFLTMVPGKHKLAIHAADDAFMPQNQIIYVYDKELRVEHNLSESPYEFHSESGTFEDRLVLYYVSRLLNTDEVDAHGISHYIEADNLHIVSGLRQIKQVSIYDLSGKLIHQKSDINKLRYSWSNRSNVKSSKAYLVKVSDIEGNETSFKIIL